MTVIRGQQGRDDPEFQLRQGNFRKEHLTISFCLKEHNGRATAWSLPLHTDTSDAHPVEEVVGLAYKGMRVQLFTHRQRRQVAVYAQCWFVNSTGLDVQIVQPGGPGRMHPVPFFADKITFLPELRNESGDS